MELLIKIVQSISLIGSTLIAFVGGLGIFIIKERSAKIFFGTCLLLGIVFFITTMLNW